MNRVEAYSASNPVLQSVIAAPGASCRSVGQRKHFVGGHNPRTDSGDGTGTLQVKARFPVAGLSPIPNTVFIRPTEVLALSGGVLVRLRQPAGTQTLLALWNPSQQIHLATSPHSLLLSFKTGSAFWRALATTCTCCLPPTTPAGNWLFSTRTATYRQVLLLLWLAPFPRSQLP
jgi:hypothetical protein